VNCLHFIPSPKIFLDVRAFDAVVVTGSSFGIPKIGIHGPDFQKVLCSLAANVNLYTHFKNMHNFIRINQCSGISDCDAFLPSFLFSRSHTL